MRARFTALLLPFCLLCSQSAAFGQEPIRFARTPVFSPDGKWLAFSSNRHGSYHVFVAPVVGGKPRRLTFDSAPDIVTGWTSDGKNVVSASSRSTAFPPNLESYTVPIEGGPERKL